MQNTEMNRIRQAQAGYKREFGFGNEKLTYKLRDPSGEREFSIPYESVDVSSPSTLTLDKTPVFQRLLLIDMLCFIAALLSGSVMLPTVITALLSVISVFLLGLAIVSRWTGWLSAKFTVMRISPPPLGTNATLTVLHDEKHDEVLATLSAKWKERLNALYGSANLNADHRQEAARLTWLRDRGVIDDLHYREEVERLTEAKSDEALSSRLVN